MAPCRQGHTKLCIRLEALARGGVDRVQHGGCCDGDQSSGALRLNGLPPGEPVIGTLTLSPDETGSVSLDIQYPTAWLIGYERLAIFGDDDGGRLLSFDRRAANDFRAALSNGATLFHRGDYKLVASELAVETLWLLGSAGARQFDEIQSEMPATQSRYSVPSVDHSRAPRPRSTSSGARL